MRSRILALLAFACFPLAASSTLAQKTTKPQPHFVGSRQCQSCHTATYAAWEKTRMANVIRDPKLHPEAVLADFTTANPLVNFTLDKVAFVYGSRYKQRFFTLIGDDYYVFPAQWDVTNKKWLPFHVADTGADWWTAQYPSDNMKRPTGPLCDGCHSVNYDLATRKVTEWNVGCEKCHGPGSEHVARPTKLNIVNPDYLDTVRSNDTCIQCHSQGQPRVNPIADASGTQRHYDWPVGYLPGQRLSDVWDLEDHRLGTTDFYYFADGTAHKNRMQGNDFSQSLMAHRDIRCSSCHSVHSTKGEPVVPKTPADATAICLDCHKGRAIPGPGITQTIPEHTHHAANSPGSQCTACHMPKIEQTLPGVFVSAHTFKFTSPKLTLQFNQPNACNQCHKDHDAAWSLKQLATWDSIAPWSTP